MFQNLNIMYSNAIVLIKYSKYEKTHNSFSHLSPMIHWSILFPFKDKTIIDEELNLIKYIYGYSPPILNSI